MGIVQGVRDPSALIQELEDGGLQMKSDRNDPFGDLKNRFSLFKTQKYL